MKIQRTIQSKIIQDLTTFNKVVVLYGPRQVGKTTLCQDIIAQLSLKTLSIDAEQTKYREILESRDLAKLQELVAGYELLFIDEAQRISQIGVNLKLLIDHVKGLKILTTGSSSFELANQIGEPLTGRKWTHFLYPLSFLELENHYNRFELVSQLEDRLIWGLYPELLGLSGYETKERYLSELISSYLYKDLFILQEIRHPQKIQDLVRLLAFQIGQEVSLNELATQLEMGKSTIARYLDLLEKIFVIFRVGGFSRNLRKEVSKMSKYYFYDLGVRNAVIDNLKPLSGRNDQGQLWENFLMMERLKKRSYQQIYGSMYFWRTYTGIEIDLIEERDGKLFGFEFKWNTAKKKKEPKSWRETYKNATWELITPKNFLDFIL